MSRKSLDRSAFLNAVQKEYGDINTITRQEVLHICEEYNLGRPLWLTKDDSRRVGRGVYSLSDTPKSKSPAAKRPPKTADIASAVPVAQISDVTNSAEMQMAAAAVIPLHAAANQGINLVPEKASGYVPFGHFADVRMIIKSGKFYPTYVTGLSGNGKTMMIEQICAQEKRKARFVLTDNVRL